MEWNYEGCIDEYGFPVFYAPKEGEPARLDPFGDEILSGSIETWENEADALKDSPDQLNELYRQFPRTEDHAFRDESDGGLFNIAKLYEQKDYNRTAHKSGVVSRGNFQWENGIQDSRVIWVPNPTGRFLTSWIPERALQNRVIVRGGLKYPGNEHIGAFGCDPYDISGTTDHLGSKGALHGLTKFSMDNAPSDTFFLEYIARPATAEIFFEDVLMACVFYGMPILAENNKPRLLYHFKRRGYRPFSMNRPDKAFNRLSATEKELGGIPGSEQTIQPHAAAIESYIDRFVGALPNGEMGDMYFDRTIDDWIRFDITKRTKHDASISSGLAIMACNKNAYSPKVNVNRGKIKIPMKKFDNTGRVSKIIK